MITHAGNQLNGLEQDFVFISYMGQWDAKIETETYQDFILKFDIRIPSVQYMWLWNVSRPPTVHILSVSTLLSNKGNT